MPQPDTPSSSFTNGAGRWLIAGGVLLLALVFYAPRLNSDGAYYYEFIRSMAFGGDLQFTDERDFFTYRYVPVFEAFLPGDWVDRGYAPNIFAIGPALTWGLPYLAVHGAARTLQQAGWLGPVTGYELGYRSVMGFSSILQGLAALLLLGRWLRKLYPERDAVFAVLIVLFASNLLAFLGLTPAFSHALSFLCSLAFLYLWHAAPGRKSAGDAVMFGAAAGAMALARWQNVFLLILPAWDAARELAAAWSARRVRDVLRRYAIMGLTAGVVLLPQVAATYILYGKPFTDPQGHGGMHWFTPWFKTILFDSNHGLFVINPVYLVGFIGLPFVWRKDRRLAVGLAAVLFSQTWINAVRRDPFGVGFGMRRFINTLPMVAFGLCALLDTARRVPGLRRALAALLLLLVPWNLLLMAQYYLTDLGAPWTHVPPGTIVSRQFTLAPQLLANLCGRSQLVSGLTGTVGEAAAGLLLTLLLLGGVAGLTGLGGRLSGMPPGKRSTLLGLAALLIPLGCAAAAGWLLWSDARSTTVAAVELRNPDALGTTKTYRQAAGQPYPGRASGLLFSRGQVLFDTAKAEYFKNKFIELGWYETKRSFYLRRAGDWAVIPVRPPQMARAIELVTAVGPGLAVARGAPLLEVEAVSGNSGQRWELVFGQHTDGPDGSGPGALPPLNRQCRTIWAWDRQGNVAARYAAAQELDRPALINEIRVRTVTPDRDVHLLGAALIQ